MVYVTAALAVLIYLIVSGVWLIAVQGRQHSRYRWYDWVFAPAAAFVLIAICLLVEVFIDRPKHRPRVK